MAGVICRLQIPCHLILAALLAQSGAKRTLMVTFSPDWNKVLQGESITMTCHGESYVTYYWYKDYEVVAPGQSYTIPFAHVGHSGIYQCRTTSGTSSDTFRLDVIAGVVILQAPFNVYEGEDLILACHSYPGYPVVRTSFYKDRIPIEPTLENLSILRIPGNSNIIGKYRCERLLSLSTGYASFADEIYIGPEHIKELFTKPNISVIAYPEIKGDNMTLTCNTTLSPLRKMTKLQYAFHRDGYRVQDFSSSDQYWIQSTRQEDSGNYTCEVKAPTSRSKRSQQLSIQIPEMKTDSQATPTTAISIGIVIILLLITILVGTIAKYRCEHSLQLTGRNPTIEPPKEEPVTNFSVEEELCYATLAIRNKVSPSTVTDNVVYSEIRTRGESW
ncbi:Fc receptor-like protein 3 [Hyperolius riggenbachi]|uniref:Fc receptor-like protein 3 n=1 Tax=Hyperolius riggenbachi TaxID=752182 RepID=UPI0035A2A896